MKAHDTDALDDQFAALLEAGAHALAAGSPWHPENDPAVPAPLVPRLQGARECLELLEALWPRGRSDPSTQAEHADQGELPAALTPVDGVVRIGRYTIQGEFGRGRYPSAPALADDLDRCLRHERPHGIPGWGARAAQGVRRHAVAVGVVLVLSGCLFAAYYLDPGRPLRQLEHSLASNKPTTVIGATGRPAWYRILNGADSTVTGTAPDGAWAVQTWSACYIELAPNGGHGSFRFSVLAHHERSDIGNKIGIFVGHRAAPGCAEDCHLMAAMTFNDLRSPATTFTHVPGDLKLPKRSQNGVSLAPWLHCETEAGLAFSKSPPAGGTIMFTPVGEGNRIYRRLDIVVTPKEVQGYWDGQRVGALSAEQFQQSVKVELESTQAWLAARNDHLPDIETSFNHRGGVGLVVECGSAWFKNATITPLAGAE